MTATFRTQHSKEPREIVAYDDGRSFSAIVQADQITLRVSNKLHVNTITFDAGDFVQQMAWLLDIEEDAT